MKGRKLETDPIGGWGRARYGATVTFRRDDDGELVTVVRERMGVEAAILAAIEEIEQQPGDWKVQSISTPGTIWRDLQGIREGGGAPGGFQNETSGPVRPSPSPEAVMLSRLGRMDLYDPPNAEAQDVRGDRVAVPDFLTALRIHGGNPDRRPL